jgi:phytochelatin synthase
MSDAALLARALASPAAAAYRDGWAYQHAFCLCGPTSLVNVLRSLGVAARRGTVLAGSGVASLRGLRGGMTLDQLALVARHHGRRATVLRDLDLAALRAELPRLAEPGRRYILNFQRRPIFGWGGGHHSPLAAYLDDVDRVLVLDVNRRVGPWLATPERLHAAIATIDRATGRTRGLLRVE